MVAIAAPAAFSSGLRQCVALGKLGEHLGPTPGAEVQHAPHVGDQLVVERMARLDAVEQFRRLLVTLRLGEHGGVSARQRLHAGDRQSQKQPVGDFGPELQVGDAETAGLPAERPHRRPGAGEHLDALVAGQHPGQPGIAHRRVERGGRVEHLRRHLRVVAGL